jgi:hypothetical protein
MRATGSQRIRSREVIERLVREPLQAEKDAPKAAGRPSNICQSSGLGLQMNVGAIREFQLFNTSDRRRCASLITERDSCDAVVSIDVSVGEGVIEQNLVMTTAATDGVSSLEPAIFTNLERVVTGTAYE